MSSCKEIKAGLGLYLCAAETSSGVPLSECWRDEGGVVGEEGPGDHLFFNFEACGVCIKVEPQFLQIGFQNVIAASSIEINQLCYYLWTIKAS